MILVNEKFSTLAFCPESATPSPTASGISCVPARLSWTGRPSFSVQGRLNGGGATAGGRKRGKYLQLFPLFSSVHPLRCVASFFPCASAFTTRHNGTASLSRRCVLPLGVMRKSRFWWSLLAIPHLVAKRTSFRHSTLIFVLAAFGHFAGPVDTLARTTGLLVRRGHATGPVE